jgi:hypothetical protein
MRSNIPIQCTVTYRHLLNDAVLKIVTLLSNR